MPGSQYPKKRDDLKTGFARDANRDAAINAVQERLGELMAEDPATIEDRLFTVENLLISTIYQLEAVSTRLARIEKMLRIR